MTDPELPAFKPELPAFAPKPVGRRGPRVPMLAHEEGPRRKRNLIIFGAVVLLSFLLPTLKPGGFGQMEILNLTQLVDEKAPALVKVMAIYPLLAGVAVMALAILAPPGTRGAVVTALGVIPLLLLASAASSGAGSSGREGDSAPVIPIFMALIGWQGLLIGARSRWYRPESTPSAAVGIAGAALFVLAVVFIIIAAITGPRQSDESASREAVSTLGNFRALFMGWTSLVGVLASLACIGASAVLCLFNLPGARFENAYKLSGFAFLLAIIGPLVLALTLAVVVFTLPRAGENAGAIILMLLKVGMWGAGLVLLLPVGATDWIVGKHPAEDGA
jgi:hypothetical protein